MAPRRFDSAEGYFVKYCSVCRLDTEHLDDPYDGPGHPICANDWGHCDDCKRKLHGPNTHQSAHCTATDRWVCIGCLRKNYDAEGYRLEAVGSAGSVGPAASTEAPSPIRQTCTIDFEE